MPSNPFLTCLRAALALLLLGLVRPAGAQGEYPSTGPVMGPGEPRTIVTVAGGRFREGGSARAVSLYYLNHTAIDAAGNLYLSEFFTFWTSEGGRILKVDPSGRVTKVAGGGLPRPGIGEGGPADLAAVHPICIALDRSGTLYLVDGYTRSIRKVSPDGIISTVLPLPAPLVPDSDSTWVYHSGLHMLIDPGGDFILWFPGGNRIYRLTPSGSLSVVAGNGKWFTDYTHSQEDVPATEAVVQPRGVALDGEGNLYFSELNRIRKITDGKVSTVCGRMDRTPRWGKDVEPIGSVQFWDPGELAFDSEGNLYVLEQGTRRIHRIGNGTVTAYAGNGSPAELYEGVLPESLFGDGGLAVATWLKNPTDLNTDAAGNLYICDSGAGRVRKVTPDGRIGSVAGLGGEPPELNPYAQTIGLTSAFNGDGGPATEAALLHPDSLAMDRQGDLYVADSVSEEGQNYGARIRRISRDGIITTYAAGDSPIYSDDVDDVPAIRCRVHGPRGLTADTEGSLYFIDTVGRRVRKIGRDGKIRTVAGNGDRVAPPGVPIGAFSGDGGPAVRAAIGNPVDLALDSKGGLYIASDEESYCVDGNIYGCFGIYTSGNYRVRRVSPDGTIQTVAGNGTKGSDGDGGPAIQASLTGPHALAVDREDNLYIMGDTDIRKVEPSGTISTVVRGIAEIVPPTVPLAVSWFPSDSLTVDSEGSLFFTSGLNSFVYRYSHGAVTRVAGGATYTDPSDFVWDHGRVGDGGPVSEALLYPPADILIDPDGHLLIGEISERVRKVYGVAAPGLLAGNLFPVPLTGDADYDGEVSIRDAVRVLQFVLGLVEPTAAERSAADVDRNSEVDVEDAVLVLKVLAGLLPGFATAQ